MRHFVRFAKVSASGSVDRVGWRLRIFLTSREAGAFAEELAEKLWRVEIGQYEDGEVNAPAERARRFRADGVARRRARPRRLIALLFARQSKGLDGRSGGIRTHDPLSPRQVR